MKTFVPVENKSYTKRWSAKNLKKQKKTETESIQKKSQLIESQIRELA